MTISRLRGAAAAFAALAMIVAWHSTAGAKAPLTITLPQGAVLPAGPDFATDVLKDAWDFSNAEDLSPDPGETPNWCGAADIVNSAVTTCFGKTAFSVSAGFAGGTTKTNDAALGLLFTGFNNIINPGRTGLTSPLDTSKYKKLAFRMNTDVVGNDPQVFWFPIAWFDAADAAVLPNFDRNFGEIVASKTVFGTKTYLVDLTATPVTGPAWTSAPMKGFRLDPNSPQSPTSPDGASHNFFYDWVRLTYADNDAAAAKQTIQWNGGTGATTIDVYDASNQNFIVNAATGIGGGSTTWNYGVLPPGVYTLRVSRTDGSAGTQAFTINTPPSVTITAPSRTSGQDYATAVLGNPWDMSSAADIVAIGSENITPAPPDFTGGILTATNTNNDPNITLLHNNNNAGGTKAIDTAKYRYLTYRMSIDGPVDIGNGSIARVFWGSGPLPNNFTTTQDILVFAGMQNYTIDLATLTSSPIAPAGGLDPATPREPWTTNRKTQLRFDPHEFGTNSFDPMPTRAFHVDDLKLTADPVSFGSYTIAFAPSANATVKLYYDTDTDPTAKTAIPGASGLTGPSFAWNTSAITPGRYYIYAEVTDGLQTVGSYSDAPVIVSAPCSFSLSPTTGSVPNTGGSGSFTLTTGGACDWTAASNASFITVTSSAVGTGNATIGYTVAANPARTVRTGTLTVAGLTFTVTQQPARGPFDFDSDGRADRVVFTPGSGIWTLQGLGTQQWGLPGDIAVPGDYNGDGALDIAVYRPSMGDWYVKGMAPFNWGRAGDVPVPADYNGDGKTDFAVTRTTDDSFIRWYVAGQFAGRVWGVRGDIPFAADFDGDGKADLAVFRPATGQWFVTFAQFNYTTTAVYTWGVPGDVPLTGDFDGDGRTDLTVFRPSTGEWFIAFSSGSFATSARYVWGIPGDIPLALDMDGDRVDDLVIYRPGDATWWTFNRITGAAAGTQFGISGDQPAAQRPQIRAVPTADFDGDHKADVTVFRPGTGEWFTRLSSTGYAPAAVQQWGLNGDKKIQGDFDGDGKTDLAVYRPSNGFWFLRFSSTGFATSTALQWGLSSDLPEPGDYDGDGRTDLAVYRPSSGQWFVRYSSTGYATTSVDQFGLSSDIPVPADYDGDGKTDLAVYRPSTGQWFLKLSSAAFGGVIVKQFGQATDVPVPGDWDGDGRADIAVYRPSTGQWLGTDALTTIRYNDRQWGLPGDSPLVHDFDGDGVVDAAVYRPGTGQWFVKFSSAPAGSLGLQWGVPNDQPLLRIGGGSDDNR